MFPGLDDGFDVLRAKVRRRGEDDGVQAGMGEFLIAIEARIHAGFADFQFRHERVHLTLKRIGQRYNASAGELGEEASHISPSPAASHNADFQTGIGLICKSGF